MHLDTVKRRVTIVGAGVILGLSCLGGTAFAEEEHPPPPPHEKVNCNAGNGNGSEGCDPGNSSGVNRGGDEAATQPDFLPNPGGNNAP